MFKKSRRLFILGVAVLACLALGSTSTALSSSSSYRIDEDFIGPGGNLDASSTNYELESGKSTLGNGGVGESSSTNFATQSGATTTADPRLACVLNTASLNLGALSTAATAVGVATFNVLNYTSYGYVVSILGNPPSSGGHTLASMSSNAGSIIGTEQFGINLKANTTPSVGADPVQVPSGTFSFGGAATNYSTANSFRYVPGETIASATKTSGETDYTISYIVNTATTTPGGSYTGSQTILCTGTY